MGQRGCAPDTGRLLPRSSVLGSGAPDGHVTEPLSCSIPLADGALEQRAWPALLLPADGALEQGAQRNKEGSLVYRNTKDAYHLLCSTHVIYSLKGRDLSAKLSLPSKILLFSTLLSNELYPRDY